MDAWLLVLTAIATVGGVWLVVLAWLDRPQHAWNIHISRERFRDVYRSDGSQDIVPIDFDKPHKETLAIKPVGTARMHGVEIRFRECKVLNASDARMYAPEWMPGSDALDFEVLVPAASENLTPYVEIRWLHLRPRQQRGQRMNIRTRRWDSWKWHWRSLWWYGRRLRRTRGRWVAHREWPYPDIPAVD